MTEADYQLANTKQFREIFQSCVRRNNIKPWVQTRTRKLAKTHRHIYNFWYLPRKIRNTLQFQNNEVRYVSFHFNYMDYKHNYEKIQSSH